MIRTTSIASPLRHANGPGAVSVPRCLTYRWLEHVGPGSDIALGYRSESELAEWQSRDPVALYRDRLGSTGDLTPSGFEAMRERISIEVEDAVAFAKSSPFPQASALTEHIVPV